MISVALCVRQGKTQRVRCVRDCHESKLSYCDAGTTTKKQFHVTYMAMLFRYDTLAKIDTNILPVSGFAELPPKSAKSL